MNAMSRNIRLIVSLALCATALTSCSSESDTSGANTGSDTSSSNTAALPEKDISSWTLPSDPYNPPDPSLEAYAIDITAAKCAKEAGVQAPIQKFDVDAPLPATTNAARHRLFDEKIAQEFGYQEEPDPRINWDDRKNIEEVTSSWNESEIEAYVACQDKALKELGNDGGEVYSYGFGVGWESDPSVQEATKKWRECMAPLGIADLEADAGPFDMPTAGLRSGWGRTDDIPPWEEPAPSAAEIEVAVHDAKCQESSGWVQAAYDAEWKLSEDYLNDNLVELNARKERYDNLRASYMEAIKNGS